VALQKNGRDPGAVRAIRDAWALALRGCGDRALGRLGLADQDGFGGPASRPVLARLAANMQLHCVWPLRQMLDELLQLERALDASVVQAETRLALEQELGRLAAAVDLGAVDCPYSLPALPPAPPSRGGLRARCRSTALARLGREPHPPVYFVWMIAHEMKYTGVRIKWRRGQARLRRLQQAREVSAYRPALPKVLVLDETAARVRPTPAIALRAIYTPTPIPPPPPTTTHRTPSVRRGR
jgi:hypothetical protein